MRLGALPPLPDSGDVPAAWIRRRIARSRAWACVGEPEAARAAIRGLVLVGEPAACAAELVETATLSRLAGLSVCGLAAAATDAARRLANPRAMTLLDAADAASACRTFLHWDA